MITQAEQEFIKQVVALFRRSQLKIEVLGQRDSFLDVEVHVASNGRTGFRITSTTNSVQRSEVEPDPRSFNDTAAVTARAMVGWYPGKSTSWTEKQRTVQVQAWNLPDPDVTNFSATVNYDAHNGLSEWDEGYNAEKLLDLLSRKISEQATVAREESEKARVAQVKKAFSGF